MYFSWDFGGTLLIFLWFAWTVGCSSATDTSGDYPIEKNLIGHLRSVWNQTVSTQRCWERNDWNQGINTILCSYCTGFRCLFVVLVFHKSSNMPHNWIRFFQLLLPFSLIQRYGKPFSGKKSWSSEGHQVVDPIKGREIRTCDIRIETLPYQLLKKRWLIRQKHSQQDRHPALCYTISGAFYI